MSFLLKKVQENTEKCFQSPEKLQFLLAVSGGMDSMILLDVFHKLSLSFHIAHANFQLRGEESNQDEAFVLEQGKKYLSDISKIHIKRFDTQKEHEKTKDTSLQMLARKLRYEWFYELLNQHNLDYLVTAHHADDNIETFFLKLFRKSPQGLAGMDILSENKIFRPLLTSFHTEIQQYAKENNILYREDSSNAKDDYLRNHIRHHLIPFIETHYPQAKSAILDTMHYQKDLNTLAHAYADEIWKNSVSKYEDCYTIDLTKLKEYPIQVQQILPWHFADRFRIGMKQFEQFKHLFEPETQTGKQMLTESYKAVRYKKSIQIFPVNIFDQPATRLFRMYPVVHNPAVIAAITEKNVLIRSDDFSNKPYSSHFFNEATYIRFWHHGDKIIYKGNKTLIADLIPEYQITPYQKEYLYVVTKMLPSTETTENDLPRFTEVILFVIFCPNSILLQLK